MTLIIREYKGHIAPVLADVLDRSSAKHHAKHASNKRMRHHVLTTFAPRLSAMQPRPCSVSSATMHQRPCGAIGAWCALA